MMNRIFPVLCTALLLTGCGASTVAESSAPAPGSETAESAPASPETAVTTLTFTDDLDREVTVPANPERVAVLLGSYGRRVVPGGRPGFPGGRRLGRLDGF